jgi:hypothetical protein
MEGLGLIVIIIAAFIVVVCGNHEKKQDNIAKFGYDPIREDYNKLPPERKRTVDEISDNRRISKALDMQQIYRRQFDKWVPQTTVYRGGKAIADKKHKTPVEGQMPSLDYYKQMASTLSDSLGNELMGAARAEARAYAAKTEFLVSIKRDEAVKNYSVIRANFEEVVDKCNNSKNKVAEKAPSKQPVVKVEVPKEPPKPYTGYNDSLFD